jgi:hypothetical protein
MSDQAVYREFLVLWPAWQEIVENVTLNTDPRTVEPQRVFGAACGCDQDRLAALLFGRMVGDTLDEAHDILREILAMARDGRRPRFGIELGLRPEDFA